MNETKRKNRRRWWLVAAGVVVLVVCAVLWRLFPPATWGEPSAVREKGTLAVRFLDVGQGDCALFTVDDTAVLIDAGTTEQPTLPYELLSAYGVTTLDAVLVSHPHADHIGGLPTVLRHLDVQRVLMPEQEGAGAYYDQTLTALAENHIRRDTPHAGDTFSFGALSATVLGPLATEAEDENDLSLCVRVEYGDVSFLFCGDMTEKEEATLLQLDDGLAADVLKVAHHGSGASSSRDFLEAVSPRVAVISCGLYNDYGHPHTSALSRLSAVGATVYRTDRRGTITVTTDGNTLSVSCEKEVGNE